MGDKPNLRFTPADSISINLGSNETARSSVVVENQGSSPVAFKVKTTQPKRYLVKPNQGVILPGASEKIQIQVVPKERQQLVTDGTPSGSSDRFLVQSVVCDESLTSLGKESAELTEKLAALWSSNDKSDVQQAKFSVSFSSPTDLSSGGASGDRLREMIQTNEKSSTSTSGADGSAAKSGGPMTPGGREFQSEVLNMRKKYDDLVSYTVNLTAERDKLKNELEQTKKDLNKAVVARLSAEKGEGGGDATRGLRVKKAAEDGFSLIQLFLVAIICFLVGRYLHS